MIPSFSFSLSAPPVPTDFGTGPVLSASSRAMPQIRDLALDLTTHDLVVTGGDLQLSAGLPSIRQDAENRMRFIRGEWFLDLTAGIPYFTDVLVKSPNLESIRGIFHEAVLGTEGISSIDRMKLSYNAGTRKLRLEWTAKSDTDELVQQTTELGVQ